MSRRAWAIGSRLLGAALIVLVVWLVGWNDRVVDPDGRERFGRVASQTDTEVVLLQDGEQRVIPIRAPGDVRRGLAGAFDTLARNPGPAGIAALLLLASAALMQVRWAVFVRGAGLDLRWPRILRFGWIGLFFNQVLPAGQVGGDLVKAYATARSQPGREHESVVSVLAERGIGLFALCLVAAPGSLAAPDDSSIALARGLALGFFAVCILFLTLISWPAARRAVRVAGLFRRLPFGRTWLRLGDAFCHYGSRPGLLVRATAVALAVHATFLGTFLFLGRALGVELGTFALFVAVPVAQMAGNLPGLPAGWGVGDVSFFLFLPAAGVPAGTAVALSFSFRALFMAISLPGGLLLGPMKAQAREAGTLLAEMKR